MILDAVKTTNKAIAIIANYIEENGLTGYPEQSESCSCICACGETQGITTYNGQLILTVAICDNCGDDDAFEGDVLEVR